jgi:hypothetical protein
VPAAAPSAMRDRRKSRAAGSRDSASQGDAAQVRAEHAIDARRCRSARFKSDARGRRADLRFATDAVACRSAARSRAPGRRGYPHRTSRHGRWPPGLPPVTRLWSNRFDAGPSVRSSQHRGHAWAPSALPSIDLCAAEANPYVPAGDSTVARQGPGGPFALCPAEAGDTISRLGSAGDTAMERPV